MWNNKKEIMNIDALEDHEEEEMTEEKEMTETGVSLY